MLTVTCVQAIRDLQDKISSPSSIKTHELFQLDVYDRALDELVNNPSKDKAPWLRVLSATGNATKVVKSRRAAVPTTSIDALASQSDDSGMTRAETTGSDDPEFDAIELRAAVGQLTGLTVQQRTLLLDLASGETAETLALRSGQPVARLREQISRARSVGWAAWQRQVLVG